MELNLDKSIEKLVESAVSEQIKAQVNAMASDIVMQKFDDPEFADQVAALAEESIERSITPKKKIEFKYKKVDDFVDGFIRRHYAITAHQEGRVNWSSQWYRHPEVVARFHTLWRSYERARQADPNGFLEEFLRVKADYHMKEIMKDSGVFASCKSSDVDSVPLPAITAEETYETKETE